MTTPTPGDLSARHAATLQTMIHQSDDGAICICAECRALKAAIAALSALPAAGGEWSGLAPRKLDELRKQGWAVNGYALYRNGERGLIDLHGAVHWLPTTPQPSAVSFDPASIGPFTAAAALMQATDAAVGAQGGGPAAAAWRAMGDENYLFGGGPFEDAHPEDQDAARRIAAAVLLAARAEPSRLRDALRCVLDIGSRRLLLPSEVVHWEALLAEASTAPAAGKGVDGEAIETIKRIAAQLATEDCEGDAADLIDAMHALTRQSAPSDDDLPGMWSHSDFTGGDPDERSHHERTRQPVAGDGDADFELWQDGEFVAGSSGPRAEAWREILHYAAQYEQDGAVTILEVIRRPLAAPAATPTDGGEG